MNVPMAHRAVCLCQMFPKRGERIVMADKLSLITSVPNSTYFWNYVTDQLPGVGQQLAYYVLTSQTLTVEPKLIQVICRRNLSIVGLFTKIGSLSEEDAREFLRDKLELGDAIHFFAKLSEDGQSILCRRSDF